MGEALVRLHLPGQMMDKDFTKVPHFFKRLLEQLAACGATTTILRRDYDQLAAVPEAGHFDFVHNGRMQRAGALNLGVAYLGRFFYADPMGVYFESTINDLTFDAGAVAAGEAVKFVAYLRREWVDKRISRHPQPGARESFGTGHIAIFLQDWSDPVERARYMDSDTMVRTVVAQAAGRPVVVKPHPRYAGRETQKIRQFLRRNHPEVRVTEANIHDILPGAAVTVSISSSVALEGLLHRVPAVLFGRSDLHHCAQTVQRPEEWPQALQQALSKTWPYDAFLFWFLRQQNIDASRPFLGRILDRMAAQGADFSALGIIPPAS